jgi:hypothetical protein
VRRGAEGVQGSQKGIERAWRAPKRRHDVSLCHHNRAVRYLSSESGSILGPKQHADDGSRCLEPGEEGLDAFDFDEIGKEIAKRAEERQIVKAALEPILEEISIAETRLSQLSVFGSDDRRRLARARVQILSVLRAQDRAERGR